MLILHIFGAMLFFAMLWAALQYDGSRGDVPADDDEPATLTRNARSQASLAGHVTRLAPVAARQNRTGAG